MTVARTWRADWQKPSQFLNKHRKQDGSRPGGHVGGADRGCRAADCGDDEGRLLRRRVWPQAMPRDYGNSVLSHFQTRRHRLKIKRSGRGLFRVSLVPDAIGEHRGLTRTAQISAHPVGSIQMIRLSDLPNTLSRRTPKLRRFALDWGRGAHADATAHRDPEQQLRAGAVACPAALGAACSR